jgi:mRNA-degrading endonuclease YafQ of YafQ-DinJ toxin-antitoxin module
MWTCLQCGEQIEDQFDSCWKCAAKNEPQELETPRFPMECLRCDGEMEYEGRKHFHEGDWTDLIRHRVHLDVYVCVECGRVELFAPAIGKEPEQQ